MGIGSLPPVLGASLYLFQFSRKLSPRILLWSAKCCHFGDPWEPSRLSLAGAKPPTGASSANVVLFSSTDPRTDSAGLGTVPARLLRAAFSRLNRLSGVNQY